MKLNAYYESFPLYSVHFSTTSSVKLCTQRLAQVQHYKEELAQLRKLNPNLNTAQLNELALEERMAEEFRDYVLTIEETAQTLPQKIRKFFKDLYNFIKALFINPVGMRQLLFDRVKQNT